jgi:lysophospholipase L1-like esterase
LPNYLATDTESTIVSQAVGGTTSRNWAIDDSGTGNPNTNNQSVPLLTNALNTFNAGNVELVHLMLGANDGCNATYKDNLQIIIDTLKDNSITNQNIKHVILSEPIYRKDGAGENSAFNQCQIAFSADLVALVAENSGFVLLGDTTAFEWFSDHQDEDIWSDSVHENSTGATKLAELWANAIESAINYQIAPAHQFT